MKHLLLQDRLRINTPTSTSPHQYARRLPSDRLQVDEGAVVAWLAAEQALNLQKYCRSHAQIFTALTKSGAESTAR